MALEAQTLRLPVSTVSLADVNRLIRELESINDELLQLKLREPHSPVKLPKTTRMMDQLVSHNKFNLLHETDRTVLSHFLHSLKTQAPIINMSFAAEPTHVFLDILVGWLRREIHPTLLLTIGLQPALGAGCVLRTTNHYWDLSLKQNFIRQRELLLDKLVPAAEGHKT